jgi:tetratricopeptide (TPR) repeat protein
MAAAELDAGRIDAGIETYKMVLALKPAAAGPSELASVLRQRGEAALSDGRQEEAARWAREALKLAEADPDAHALLGAALAASRNWSGAADEYRKALSSRPDDRSLRRSLERMRQRLEVATRPRRPAPAATAPPPALPPPPINEDSLMAPGTTSAAIESAAKK